MFRQEIWQDLKGIGGVPLYLVVTLLALTFDKVTLFVQLVIGLILAFAVTAIIRFVYFKERPIKQEYRTMIERIDASSFPSLHTGRAAVLGTLLILHVQNLWGGVIIGLAALGVAAARVSLKRHFVWDVIFGLLIGVVIGFAAVQITALLPLSKIL